MGDSIVKGLNGWDLSKKNECYKFSVKSFSGAKVECMKDYIKPSLRESPDHFIIHIGTNDVSDQNKDSKMIAESIVSLAEELRKDAHDVLVSNIITSLSSLERINGTKK